MRETKQNYKGLFDVKVLEGNPTKWSDVIEGVLFVHGFSIHYSTKYLLFFLLYNRPPYLPIDIKYDLIKESTNTDDQPYDFETFQAVFSSSSKIQDVAHHAADKNIKKAQKKQQSDYNKLHGTPITILKIGTSPKSKAERQKRWEVYV